MLILHATEHIVDSADVVHIKLSLPVVGVRGVDVGDGAVAVPFEICHTGVLGENIVNNAEHIVLHLGVAHVKHKLVAVIICLPVGLFYNPVGMFLVELALGVDHLRLYPDAELDARLISRFHQCAYASGKFVVRHLPVAQTGTVVLARIFVAEPSVVEKEHVHSQMLRLLHQFSQDILIEVEAGVLPVVQQGEAASHAILQLVSACPVMQVAASLACAVVA